MPEKDSDLIRLEVRCNPDAPCIVRGALGQALEGHQLLDDARLIASELVTNAVRYSGGGPDDVITFRARFGDDCLLVSVNDPCIAGQTAHMLQDRDRAWGGFGLRIVQQVSRRWGAEHPNGQRVWAELALSS